MFTRGYLFIYLSDLWLLQPTTLNISHYPMETFFDDPRTRKTRVIAMSPPTRPGTCGDVEVRSHGDFPMKMLNHQRVCTYIHNIYIHIIYIYNIYICIYICICIYIYVYCESLEISTLATDFRSSSQSARPVRLLFPNKGDKSTAARMEQKAPRQKVVG